MHTSSGVSSSRAVSCVRHKKTRKPLKKCPPGLPNKRKNMLLIYVPNPCKPRRKCCVWRKSCSGSNKYIPKPNGGKCSPCSRRIPRCRINQRQLDASLRTALLSLFHRGRPCDDELMIPGFVEDVFPNIRVSGEEQPLPPQYTAILKTFSYAVVNKGSHPVTVKVEISPNREDYMVDTQEVVLPGKVAVLVPNRFLKWTRLSAVSAAGQASQLDVYFQSQTIYENNNEERKN